MSLNLTACWLDAKLSPTLVQFSANVTTNNLYLKGPGGASGDGFPIPKGGLIRSLTVWDGTTLHTISEDISLAAGDRIAAAGVYETTPGTFTVAVLKNFSSLPLSLSGLPPNSTYFVTVELLLKEDA
jgi:hypothetical protein